MNLTGEKPKNVLLSLFTTLQILKTFFTKANYPSSLFQFISVHFNSLDRFYGSANLCRRHLDIQQIDPTYTCEVDSENYAKSSEQSPSSGLHLYNKQGVTEQTKHAAPKITNYFMVLLPITEKLSLNALENLFCLRLVAGFTEKSEHILLISLHTWLVKRINS